MKVHVEFRPRRQEDRPIELADGANAEDLVHAVGESTDIIVVVRGNTPIPEDEVLVDGETLLLLSAASGG
jgi:sulfur carrier protein ThiS